MAHHAESTSHADAHAANHGEHGHGGEHAHGTTEYWMIFFILMVLLLATVFAAFVNMGHFNVPVAYTIAIVKAGLILWYFMHLKQSTRLAHVFAFASFAWLALMLIITMGDYLSRHILGRADAQTHIRQVDSWERVSGISDSRQMNDEQAVKERKEKAEQAAKTGGAGHGGH
jgi:cytochrome c oxidase subunit 4